MQYELTNWQIEGRTRWFTVLGGGFGLVALLTGQLAVREHLPLTSSIMLLSLTGLFFWLSWRQRRNLDRSFSRAVAQVVPDEAAPGEHLSIEVKLPKVAGITVTTWSIALWGFDLRDEGKKEKDRKSMCATTYSEVVRTTGGSQDFSVFACKLFIPERTLPQTASSMMPLTWMISFGFGLERGGSLTPRGMIPVRVVPREQANRRFM